MQDRKAWKHDITEKGMTFERGMTAEEALGIKKPATEETLQRIDGTLKRMESILLLVQNQLSAWADQVPLEPK